MTYRYIRVALLFIGVIAIPVAPMVAQSPLPATPTAAAAPQTGAAPVTTLKANAQLVVVDVVVTDSKQGAVRNLKASDFTLLENGAPQQITSFEEHVALTPAQIASIPPMRPLPEGIFTNFSPVPPGTTVNVLLLDALNTQMKDQSYVRDQLLQFLKNTPVGTRIAIFVLNDRLIMLQGFTSDLAALKSVVEKTTPGSSRQLADSTGNYDNVGNGGTQTASQVMGGIAGDDMAQLQANFQQAEATMAAMDTQNRAKQTLDAMNQMAHYLSGIPGRKNLIWFSGSFPITIFPEPDIEHPFSVVASSEDEFRETTNLMARAQVAVYPIDARGLKTFSTAIATESSAGNSSGKGLTMAKDKLFQDNANEHSTMNRMAADTGGQAFVDTNGLSEAVGKAIESGSNYYTLSYTPTDSKQDGKFRKIQVKLAKQGVTMAYRSGYYADDADAKARIKKSVLDISLPGINQKNAGVLSSETAAPAESGTLTRAMLRGAPDATEILLKLQVLPASIAVENGVAAGNVLKADPTSKLKVKGLYKRYVIDVAANAKDIQITPTPDGHYQFLVQVLTFVYDTNGKVINTAVLKARGNLSASTYANMRRTGLPFRQEISVPINGDYYLRTSVHDLETDRIGAVEIPVASVAKLAPLAPVTNTPAPPTLTNK